VNGVSAARTLAQLVRGSLTTQLISVASTLGIADLLQSGPKSAGEIAAAVGADPSALYRVLRALAGMGIFAERSDGRFEMTPLAEPLRRDALESVHSSAELYGSTWWWGTAGALLHTVRSGETAFEHVHGLALFEYLQRNAAAATLFNEHQANMTHQDAAAIVAAYDFAGLRTVVDVGGGQGILLAAIVQAYPEVRGVLFEMPSVVDQADTRLRTMGVRGRCEVVAGDFFKEIPAGGDAYILKDIVHDWDDERAIDVLTNCRKAVRNEPNGKVLVIEKIIPPGNEPFAGKLTDITMLLMTGGRERTGLEYGTLLATAGLTVRRIVPTQSPASIIDAVPVTGTSAPST
jgi:O-methyltransferase domain/Dimerisation domain